MEYVCHRRYKKIGASGRDYNFPRETTLQTIGQFIAYNNSAVCKVSSEDAYMYFARNDDGKGLERGNLTYAIAYAPRKPNKDNGYRFTDKEIEILEKDYGRFLRNDTGTIRFNYDFFNADIEELKQIKERLVI